MFFKERNNIQQQLLRITKRIIIFHDNEHDCVPSLFSLYFKTKMLTILQDFYHHLSEAKESGHPLSSNAPSEVSRLS
uniref:Uncharacterized protein n=1 Tax=Triticum urartu TaxID=4572 RepID=A0A8R7QCD6_TRIUA